MLTDELFSVDVETLQPGDMVVVPGYPEPLVMNYFFGILPNDTHVCIKFHYRHAGSTVDVGRTIVYLRNEQVNKLVAY